jgi:hypothetical protein
LHLNNKILITCKKWGQAPFFWPKIQIVIFIIKNVGLMNQAPTKYKSGPILITGGFDESSPYIT